MTLEVSDDKGSGREGDDGSTNSVSPFCHGQRIFLNTLFRLRNMPVPADLSDPNNMSTMLINNMLREEQIARQRAPFDNKIFAKLRCVDHASK